MSRETMTWLNTNTLIGFTEKRGNAWHYRADSQGDEPNHYTGAIPADDVIRRLFAWNAISVPIYVNVPDFGMMPVDGRQAIARDDSYAVMGMFKEGYTMHQYRETLIDNMANIIDTSSGDLGIGSAGLLRNGAQAWVSIEVPDNIVTPEGVEFRPHLLACTSHDGSLATTYKRVVTNVVCDNTMAAGLAEQGQAYRIKHSKYSKLKLNDARDALAIVHTIGDDFAAEVAELCAIDVSNKAWSEFLNAHSPVPETAGRSLTMALNTRESLTQLWNSDIRVSPWRNTAWGVVQAVNTYEHHTKTVRGATRPERNMTRALTGGVDTLDTDTMSTLRKVLASA
jgi:phage/plasmid-like protein (TIGR03299 family)